MTDEERAKIEEQFDEISYTRADLEREIADIAYYKKKLADEEEELASKEKQILVKREKLLAGMTDTELGWETLRAELEKLLHSETGVVAHFRDGCFEPSDENERIITLCGEASALILRHGCADIPQFNFFVDMIWQLSKRPDMTISDRLFRYLDELTDALMVPEA